MAPRSRTRTRTRGMVARKPSVRQGIPKDVLIELSTKHDKECMFCGRKEISEKLYGPLYQLNDVVVHYFCILLSSKAHQNGGDKEGIWGFLLKDIKAEINRGSKEVCCYCKKTGATIVCCGLRCLKVFHLPCGLQNGSMHQYYKAFKSFCQQHRITQTVDIKELQNTASVECAICKEDVIPTPLPSSLWAPCCKRNAWFHRDCVQSLAISSGYFFKCPLCNNLDTFKSRMLTLGIYIPSRDASWEVVPNAYAELLERHRTCDAEVCLCPHALKRNYYQENGSWDIILCHTCGSSGTHKLCSSLKCDQLWYCLTCREISEGSVSVKRRRLGITIDVASNGVSSNGVSSNGVSFNRMSSSRMSSNRMSSNGVSNRKSANGMSSNDVPSNDVSSCDTTLEESSTAQNRNLRRTSTRVATRNMGTRGSARLINNNNMEVIRNESSEGASKPQGVIVISDDGVSDTDSDVQCITYLNDPPPPPRSIPLTQLPVITSVSSMNINAPLEMRHINYVGPSRYIPTIDLTSDYED